MNRKYNRQCKILETLKRQGTGVVNISDEKLSALTSIPKRTLSRDLNEMDKKSIIIKDTNLIKLNGATRKQRDILVPGEQQRRFTLDQHRQLSDKANHRTSTNEFGEHIWERQIDGQWERNMIDKEFESTKQIWSWIYPLLSMHHKKYTEGDRYESRN